MGRIDPPGRWNLARRRASGGPAWARRRVRGGQRAFVAGEVGHARCIEGARLREGGCVRDAWGPRADTSRRRTQGTAGRNDGRGRRAGGGKGLDVGRARPGAGVIRGSARRGAVSAGALRGPGLGKAARRRGLGWILRSHAPIGRGLRLRGWASVGPTMPPTSRQGLRREQDIAVHPSFVPLALDDGTDVIPGLWS